VGYLPACLQCLSYLLVRGSKSLHLYLLYSYVPPPLPAAAQHTQDTTDEMQHNAQDFAAGIAALNQKQKKGGGFLGGLLS
jgi:hypothetical protein